MVITQIFYLTLYLGQIFIYLCAFTSISKNKLVVRVKIFHDLMFLQQIKLYLTYFKMIAF